MVGSVNVNKSSLRMKVAFHCVQVLFVKIHTFAFNPLKRNG